MKIAVCDDDARDLAQIRAVLDKIKVGYELEAQYFSSGEELMSCLKKGGDFPLVILDVCMQGIDGIKTAYLIREHLPRTQIAFLTSSSEYAVDAFDVGALHYVIKPVTAEKLAALFQRFYKQDRTVMKNLELRSRSKAYSFPILSVQKVLSSNKGVDIYLKTGDTVPISESFSTVEKQLDTSLFLKISRGLIVNMTYILCMNNEICRFKDGTEALISRKEKSDIRRRYNDFLFESREEGL